MGRLNPFDRILIYLAVAVLVGLCVAYALLIFTTRPAHAGAPEHQIRRDCYADALRYCKAAIITTDRSAIIACMLENRDKLQAKCSRHFYSGTVQ